MPRSSRIVLPGYPHHVIQLGHNKQAVFLQEADFVFYLATLAELKQRFDCRVFSYNLTTARVLCAATHRQLVPHQVPFLNPTLALLGQPSKNLAQPLPYLPKDPLFAVLRDEHDVVLTLSLLTDGHLSRFPKIDLSQSDALHRLPRGTGKGNGGSAIRLLRGLR